MVTADGHIVIRRYDNNKYWYRCIRVRSIRICTYSLMFSNFRIVYETLVSYTKSRATDCNLTSMSSGFQNRSRKTRLPWKYFVVKDNSATGTIKLGDKLSVDTKIDSKENMFSRGSIEDYFIMIFNQARIFVIVLSKI